jgi:hypothetical protein
LFETELQLRIAELAGAYCGFEPVIYFKKTNYYHTELTNLISKASIRASQTVDCPADPADNNSPSGNFIFKMSNFAANICRSRLH